MHHTIAHNSGETYGDLRTSETRAGVETDTISTSTAVNLDLTGVGLEVLRRILSSDTALDGEAALRDSFLRKAELGESCTRSDLNLRCHDIDASNLLCTEVSSRPITRNAAEGALPVIVCSTWIRGLISIK